MRILYKNQRGSALLEVMIALAIIAMVAMVAATVLGRGLVSYHDRMHKYWLTEFARSVLTEYTSTYPNMPASGERSGGWNWSVEEHIVENTVFQSPEIPIYYVKLLVNTWNSHDPDIVVSVTAWMARRRE